MNNALFSQPDLDAGKLAKSLGLAFNSKAELDWQMGWLMTDREKNGNAEGVPADWNSVVTQYLKDTATEFPESRKVSITIEFPVEQAAALAQFVERVGWPELRDSARDTDEAEEMREAIYSLGGALATAGFAGH